MIRPRHEKIFKRVLLNDVGSLRISVDGTNWYIPMESNMSESLYAKGREKMRGVGFWGEEYDRVIKDAQRIKQYADNGTYDRYTGIETNAKAADPNEEFGEYWRCKDGRVMHMSNMSTDHLIAVVALLWRNVVTYRMGRDSTQLMEDRCGVWHGQMDYALNELQRRRDA